MKSIEYWNDKEWERLGGKPWMKAALRLSNAARFQKPAEYLALHLAEERRTQ